MSEDATRRRSGASDAHATRPKSLYVLIAALAFQGLSGVAGGFGLAFDPSGESVSLPLEWLDGSPFADYLVPGIVLLTLLGFGPLIVAYGVGTRRGWSWAASLLVAVGLFVWLGVEIAVVGYQAEPPLQLAYAVVGAVILVTVLLPGVRSHLTKTEP